MASKTGKIGLVGGYPIPEVNRLMHAFMAGANDYIAKPLDVERLLSLVRVWMPK